jgi:nicotinamidase-related amidase
MQNGSLAVPNGRDIAPIINQLLALPFAVKVATKDWHPTDHISFASNHTNKEPFVNFTTVTNPTNPSETYETRLWPVHCIQNTPGAALIPELDVAKVDHIINKGMRKEVEMYSAFYDPFEKPRVSDSGLTELLKSKGITDVYVVGLAADYCVQSTARHAKSEGFRAIIIEEATRPVDQEAWDAMDVELYKVGVEIVSLDGEQVAMVGKL